MWADAGMALRQSHSRHNAETVLCHADRLRAPVSFSATVRASYAVVLRRELGLTTVIEARTRLCAPICDLLRILLLPLSKKAQTVPNITPVCCTKQKDAEISCNMRH